MIKTISSFTDAASSMTWGSPSVGTWRKACDDSLSASRRRRVETRSVPFWEYVVCFLVIGGLFVGGLFAFAWLIYLGFDGGLW